MEEKNRFSFVRLAQKTKGELFIFVIIMVAVSFLLPRAALTGLLSLLASKVLTLTLGVFLAHLLRIIAFRYLDLSQMIEDHHWAGVIFLAVWYGVIIYAVAVGG